MAKTRVEVCLVKLLKASARIDKATAKNAAIDEKIAKLAASKSEYGTVTKTELRESEDYKIVQALAPDKLPF